MKTAVITVIGKDTVGILAKVSTLCAEYSVNVEEVTQSILKEMFAMIMLTDVSNLTIPFSEFADKAKELGEKEGLSIFVMHEDIFNSMHKI